VIVNYNTSATTNPAYPTATVAIASSPNNTSYYSSTANLLNYYGGNVYVVQGTNTVAATFNYTTPAIYAIYPMSLNTTTVAPINGTVNITSPAPATGAFTGSCSVIADGSGTLTLPGTNTTFTNALRVVTSQTLNVTTSFGIPATVLQVSYDYYSIGIRNPIFSIATASATILGNTSTQTLVTRDKNATAATATIVTPPPTPTYVTVYENQAAALSLNVYPNPSSSSVNFTTDSPNAAQVVVYDITGKLVDKFTFVDGKVKMDVNDLNTGLYLYTVTGNDGRTLKTGKVTVNH
jgi:hypothetical protein